ncbi:hypothetical protein PQ469_24785 [Mucilaginibacter sp. KACC 22773]|uniref:hypothetical protein n=1 Tax=Mucilaginibacter sp. KACC 22773 TaxID=3025671 RepID=UPI0023655061|nr:hypothetical protein [Mucilaginibacter sp. KACC 22773]WDF77105.1 hypothetical protein PQ469_24785 [Mucilaginibacter sp. KACC 22773]
MATAIAILNQGTQRNLFDSFSFFSNTRITTAHYFLHLFGVIMFCAALPLLSNSYVRWVNTIMIVVLGAYILLGLLMPDLVSLISGILLFLLNVWLKRLYARDGKPQFDRAV